MSVQTDNSNSLNRVSWQQQLIFAVGMGAVFFLVYIPINLLSSLASNLPNLYMPWETHIPFVAEMILPYMSLDVLFVLSFFALKEEISLHRHAGRIALVIGISATLFKIVPLQFGFIRPETFGWEGVLFDLLSMDLPYNQFPSLHISLSLIIWPVIRNVTSGWKRKALAVWFIAIGLSTLLTYQHHFIDILGGLFVGSLVLYMVPLKQENVIPVTRQAIKMALRYLIGAFMAILIAANAESWGVLMLYPAISLLLVAGAYLVGRSNILYKQKGRYCFVTWLLFGPYIIGSWLNWLCYKSRLPAWSQFSKTLFFGRKLTRQETIGLKQKGITAVLDLSPELMENSDLVALNYCHIPMLDLLEPGQWQLEQAMDFITKQQQQGKVFIHCALGMSRSLVVLLTHLIKEGEDYSTTLAYLKNHYPHIYLPAYQLDALTADGNLIRENNNDA